MRAEDLTFILVIGGIMGTLTWAGGKKEDPDRVSHGVLMGAGMVVLLIVGSLCCR